MRTIYLVNTRYDYEGTAAIKAFTDSEAANAFAELCEKHIGRENHPAGFRIGDGYEVEAIDLID